MEALLIKGWNRRRTGEGGDVLAEIAFVQLEDETPRNKRPLEGWIRLLNK